MHYREVEDQQTKIRRHIKVENEIFRRELRDWRDEVKRESKLDAKLDKFIDMIIKFDSIWDDDLSRISVAKHCIELSTNEIRLYIVPSTEHGQGLVSLKKLRSIEC